MPSHAGINDDPVFTPSPGRRSCAWLVAEPRRRFTSRWRSAESYGQAAWLPYARFVRRANCLLAGHRAFRKRWPACVSRFAQAKPDPPLRGRNGQKSDGGTAVCRATSNSRSNVIGRPRIQQPAVKGHCVHSGCLGGQAVVRVRSFVYRNSTRPHIIRRTNWDRNSPPGKVTHQGNVLPNTILPARSTSSEPLVTADW